MKSIESISKSPKIRVIEVGEDGIAFQTGSLRVIASNGGGWDHVSVSMERRCPTWAEMEFVRDICFLDEEAVVQYSAPRSQHINIHPNCLHMWRPHGFNIAMPPKEFV